MCFFAFMFSLFSLLLYVFIDVRLSHLNKDYLLTYLLTRWPACWDYACSGSLPLDLYMFNYCISLLFVLWRIKFSLSLSVLRGNERAIIRYTKNTDSDMRNQCSSLFHYSSGSLQLIVKISLNLKVLTTNYLINLIKLIYGSLFTDTGVINTAVFL